MDETTLIAGADGTDAELALLELAAGHVGNACVGLLRRLARQFTRSDRCTFPPPDGYARWCDDAVDDFLVSMFDRADQDDPATCHKFLLSCFVLASDGPSLERLLLEAIANFLIDQAKKTELGKLRRRLTNLLDRDDRFVSRPGERWQLGSGDGEAWQGDITVLRRAALGVRGLEITRWNTSGPTPRDTVEALLCVAEQVLMAAAGSVHIQDLARVIQGRFLLLRSHPQVARATHVSLDDERLDRSTWASTESGVDVRIRAEQLCSALSAEEQSLVPHLADPTAWAEVLKVGKSTARVAGMALRERIRLATVDDDDRDSVVTHLAALCGSQGGS